MIYTYAEGVRKYKTKYFLKSALSTGELYQLEKGIYSDKSREPELAIISKKYPNAVFTMDSAFYYYDLTDVIPEKYHLATDRDATKIADKRVKQIFERSDLLNVGVTSIEKNGTEIKIYSRERLLIELLRHKNTLPFDYYKEVLVNFRDIIYDLDLRAIEDYAFLVPKSDMVMNALQMEVL